LRAPEKKEAKSFVRLFFGGGAERTPQNAPRFPKNTKKSRKVKAPWNSAKEEREPKNEKGILTRKRTIRNREKRRDCIKHLSHSEALRGKKKAKGKDGKTSDRNKNKV